LRQRNDLPDSGIRLTLTGGYSPDGFAPAKPNLVITQQPLASLPTPEPTRSIRVVSYPHRRQLPDVKTIDYLMAVWLQPYMRGHGGEDILYHSDGIITECPRANFFIVTDGGTLVTPVRDILRGVTRGKVLGLARERIVVEERDITLAELRTAKEAFVTSTGKHVLPVSQVDDVVIGGPGPVSRWLSEALYKLYFALMLVFFFVAGAGAQQVIHTDSPADLIPESITYSRATGLYYISSINRHKIVTIDRRGHCTDFLTSDEHGYLQGLGLKADDRRGLLWGVSNGRSGARYRSLVQAFDLHTHALVFSAALEDTAAHLFNDLAVANDGKVYLTDTYLGAVYLFDPLNKRLSLFRRDGLLFEPNGIVAGDSVLYVTSARAGIVRYPLDGGTGLPLSGVKDTVAARMLDGFIRIGRRLYAVANDFKDAALICVIEYTLDAAGKRVVAEKIIDRNNAAFNIPTGITVDGNGVMVLANTYLDAYNKNGESTRGLAETLKPIILLRYKSNL
jgi:D-alanine transaminase/branched-chain amino acid aminotransferase